MVSRERTRKTGRKWVGKIGLVKCKLCGEVHQRIEAGWRPSWTKQPTRMYVNEFGRAWHGLKCPKCAHRGAGPENAVRPDGVLQRTQIYRGPVTDPIPDIANAERPVHTVATYEAVMREMGLDPFGQRVASILGVSRRTLYTWACMRIDDKGHRCGELIDRVLIRVLHPWDYTFELADRMQKHSNIIASTIRERAADWQRELTIDRRIKAQAATHSTESHA